MKNIAIIGAGELGTRHLQGVLKSKLQHKVYVLDISDNSLNIAKQRASEVVHACDIYYIKEFRDLPSNIFIAIIASSANVREQLVNYLFTTSKVENLILEKVLFQKVSSFNIVDEILNINTTKVWVNHPRRMWKDYSNIKMELGSSGPYIFHAVGGNWGLACNSLHFIDLFAFISDENLISIDTNDIDSTLLESKRAGFVEFTGQIRGKLSGGSSFLLHSFKGDKTPFSISMFSARLNVNVMEGTFVTPNLIGDSSQYFPQLYSINSVRQSDLTTHLVESLIETGDCALTPYKVASNMHRIFIQELLEKYNSLSSLKSDVCPIT